MRVTLFTAAFLTILSTASLAQNAVSIESNNVTSSQAKSLVRSAKTAADYLTLRDYYAHLARVEGLKAAEEKQEWDRRAANPAVYARKYPSPVDSAHYLYDAHLQSAKAAAAAAERYEKLAAAAKGNS